MKLQVIGQACLVVAGVLAAVSQTPTTYGQEIWPNPALSRARSATLANGGIESEWDYHRYANSSSFQTRFTPISRDAGGVGYCCPTRIAPYYGCDTGRSCYRSKCCR